MNRQHCLRDLFWDMPCCIVLWHLFFWRSRATGDPTIISFPARFNYYYYVCKKRTLRRRRKRNWHEKELGRNWMTCCCYCWRRKKAGPLQAEPCVPILLDLIIIIWQTILPILTNLWWWWFKTRKEEEDYYWLSLTVKRKAPTDIIIIIIMESSTFGGTDRTWKLCIMWGLWRRKGERLLL